MSDRHSQKKRGPRSKLVDPLVISTNSAHVTTTNNPRRPDFISNESLFFSNTTDVRQTNSKPAPPQAVARSQFHHDYGVDRQTSQLGDENNVSPVSFSAKRSPVSPMSSLRFGSQGSSQHPRPPPSVPVRRNAVRRSNNDQARASIAGLGAAPVDSSNNKDTALPSREVRRKKAQTFGQRPRK